MISPFLELKELEEITATVKLPDGWSVEVYQDRYLGPHVRFVGRVVDSRKDPEPGFAQPMTTLGVNACIPPYARSAHYMNWLHKRWIEIWIHEARETFWVNGLLWDDPHKET